MAGSVSVVPQALSFGSILKEFPDFLFCVLRYITDRVVWNAIASSNKDMYGKSKAIQPPWPLWYRLPSINDLDPIIAWSPCGTRVAYKVWDYNIVIVDQRRGPFRNNENNNNDFGRSAHNDYFITGLEFSSDGSYLVSTGEDGFIRLWDVTENYALLQEWNMRDEITEEVSNISNPNFSISACSKYITVSFGTWTYLKDVEGKTIKSLILPFVPNENRIHINNIMFSSDDRAVFICCNEMIKAWRPYHDNEDEDHLITLCRNIDLDRGSRRFIFSHDKSMVVIHNEWTNTGVLCSVDTAQITSFLQRSSFHRSTGFHFTPDGKYILVNRENGPFVWGISESKYTNKTMYVLDIGYYTRHSNLTVKSLSPNNRQYTVRDRVTGNQYITSYLVKY